MLVLTGALAAAALSLSPAHAQMSNKPYSFQGSGWGGLGMSSAGKQVIMEKKLGRKFDNIIKGPNGELLTVEKGPGGIAVVTGPDGQIFPSYRGRGFARGMTAGDFNSFFVKPGRYHNLHVDDDTSTKATIESWTGTVHGYPNVYSRSSVDQWTSLVYFLR
jgi:hypothetical protein